MAASRKDRWNKAVKVLATLQEEFQGALDNLNDKEFLNADQEEMIDLLEEIVEHDIEALEVA